MLTTQGNRTFSQRQSNDNNKKAIFSGTNKISMALLDTADNSNLEIWGGLELQ